MRVKVPRTIQVRKLENLQKLQKAKSKPKNNNRKKKKRTKSLLRLALGSNTRRRRRLDGAHLAALALVIRDGARLPRGRRGDARQRARRDLGHDAGDVLRGDGGCGGGDGGDEGE